MVLYAHYTTDMISWEGQKTILQKRQRWRLYLTVRRTNRRSNVVFDMLHRNDHKYIPDMNKIV